MNSYSDSLTSAIVSCITPGKKENKPFNVGKGRELLTDLAFHHFGKLHKHYENSFNDDAKSFSCARGTHKRKGGIALLLRRRFHHMLISDSDGTTCLS